MNSTDGAERATYVVDGPKRRLKKLREDPEFCMELGMRVLSKLIEGDRAVSYVVERSTVRTRAVQEGTPTDVKRQP